MWFSIALFFNRILRQSFDSFDDFLLLSSALPAFKGDFSLKNNGSTLNIGDITITGTGTIYFEIKADANYKGFIINLNPFKFIYSLADGTSTEECVTNRKYAPLFVRLFFELERIGLGEIAEIIRNHGEPCTQGT